MTEERAELFNRVFQGVKFSFSRNCCSGIIHMLGPDAQCQCWRCRGKRGEGVTAQTEEFARVVSDAAKRAWDRYSDRLIRDHSKPFIFRSPLSGKWSLYAKFDAGWLPQEFDSWEDAMLVAERIHEAKHREAKRFCELCHGEHAPMPPDFFIDFRGWRFFPPFVCMGCGVQICHRQWEFSRNCASCSTANSSTRRVLYECFAGKREKLPTWSDANCDIPEERFLDPAKRNNFPVGRYFRKPPAPKPLRQPPHGRPAPR